MHESEFTIFWWTAFGFLTVSYSLFFWFAVRCGMLKDQDRARYLPLWAEVPEALQFGVQSSESGVEEPELESGVQPESKGPLKKNSGFPPARE